VILLLNGKFVPEEQAVVSVFDRGFLYGDGLFETIRVINGGILLALAGGFLDPKLGSVGWSLASSAMIIWLFTLLGTRLLFSRSKPGSLA
jgi:hypothetical protein